MPNTSGLWTIDELGSQVALALAENYNGTANGRVRAVPDLRTIRYYTTIGLLDRPAEMRGRTALYGRRHLLQLVAIKRLQARGLALAEIQRQLLGLSDTALAELAHLPANGGSAPDQIQHDESRPDFWKAPPVEPPPAENHLVHADPCLSARNDQSPLSLQGVPLGEEVTLLFAAVRAIEPDDIEALRTVAAPLLKLLRSRRLLGQRQERDPR
jgi:DNA-binding transcriptional MerR regulator